MCIYAYIYGIPQWLRWERICLRCRTPGFDPWVRKIPQRKEWLPAPVFLPGEFHRQKSLAGYSPWGPKGLDMAERLTLSLHFRIHLQVGKTHTHFCLSKKINSVMHVFLVSFPYIFSNATNTYLFFHVLPFQHYTVFASSTYQCSSIT